MTAMAASSLLKPKNVKAVNHFVKIARRADEPPADGCKGRGQIGKEENNLNICSLGCIEGRNEIESRKVGATTFYSSSCLPVATDTVKKRKQFLSKRPGEGLSRGHPTSNVSIIGDLIPAAFLV